MALWRLLANVVEGACGFRADCEFPGEMAISEKSKMQLRQKYSTELKALIGRSLTKQDGVKRALLATCEKRLKLKLPTALRTYYELAGNLPINKEHNI